MPAKRRLEKRRLSPAAELEAWESIFDSGFDYFDELPALGVSTDEYGRPDAEMAGDAWRRLGATFLASRTPTPDHEPWALQMFGDPHAS